VRACVHACVYVYVCVLCGWCYTVLWCMCVYVRVCCVRVHVYVHARVCVYVHARVCVYVRVRCVCMYLCACVCLCMCVRACVCLHKHICVRMRPSAHAVYVHAITHMCIPWRRSKLVPARLVCFCAAYLVFDIQLLMGTGAVSISPDEYVFAALTIYLDVLNLFLYLLQVSDVSANPSE